MGPLGPGPALEDRRPDIPDRPPLPETGSDFLSGHPPRAVPAGLLFAEGEHEVVPVMGQNRDKVIHKDRAVLIGQDMEEP